MAKDTPKRDVPEEDDIVAAILAAGQVVSAKLSLLETEQRRANRIADDLREAIRGGLGFIGLSIFFVGIILIVF